MDQGALILIGGSVILLIGVWLFASYMSINRGRCPYCRRGVDSRATVCPHCQRELATAPPEPYDRGRME